MLKGIVRDCGSDAPRSGIHLLAWVDGVNYAGAVSDASGHFTMLLETQPRWTEATCVWLTVQGRDASRETDAFVRWSDVERTEALVLVCDDQSPLGPLLVDRTTSQPLPGFQIECPAPQASGRTIATTLSNGCLPKSVDLSMISELAPIDQPGLADQYRGESLRWGANSRGIPVLSVLTGPTYRLSATLPDRTPVSGSLRARFWTVDSLLDLRLPSAEPKVREGSVRWIRLGPRASDLLRIDTRCILGVRTEDGFASGSVLVDTGPGMHMDVLAIPFEATGNLHGKLSLGIAPTSSPLEIRVSRAGPGRQLAPESMCASVAADGTFELRGLDPSSYEVVAQRPTGVLARARVDVTAGRTTELDLSADSVRDGGLRISGALRLTGSASYEPVGARVVLRDEKSQTGIAAVKVNWVARGDDKIAPFEFADIAPGEYLVVAASDDWCEWEPKQVRVSPGMSGIELVGRFSGAAYSLAFEVSDALTARQIKEFSIRVLYPSGATSVTGGASGRPCILGVNAAAVVSWTIAPEGYEKVYGVTEMGSAVVNSREGVVTTSVRCRPGWGDTVRVTTEDDHPVAGVEVRVGEEAIGMTDAQGNAAVYSSRAPRKLVLSVGGGAWRVVGGDIDGQSRELLPSPYEAAHIVVAPR